MVDCVSLRYSAEAKQIEVVASVQKLVERPEGFAAAEACCVHYSGWIPDRKAQNRCPVVPVVAVAVAAQCRAAAAEGRKDLVEVQLSSAHRDAVRVTSVGVAEPVVVAAAAAAAVVVVAAAAVAAVAVVEPAVED